ncbi:phage holin family protein [Caldalkalibacillus salinus]|uniref:phage holin family protein n=1 Tax=Caldalkalibacillus salinus TaxID=2803787 RepID=UPI0019249135
MDLLLYIKDELYALIPVLWIIGNFLKITPVIKNWTIPWILLSIAIIFSTVILGLTIQAFLQGVLVTGGAVLVHQLIKQTREKN